MGKVEDLIMGAEGGVRGATVCTLSESNLTFLERPIQHLEVNSNPRDTHANTDHVESKQEVSSEHDLPEPQRAPPPPPPPPPPRVASQ